MNEAYVDEVFASVQGEGARVGQRHVFVRFLSCDLRCRYCDTPDAAVVPLDACRDRPCRVQRTGLSTGNEQIPNPVAGDDLARFCGRLRVGSGTKQVLSLTGGEPLVQAAFLRHWLPAQRAAWTVLLETAGVRVDDLLSVRDMIDIVSMDMKLPSATGLRPYWDEHERFLEASRGKEVSVKAVVTRDTLLDEVIAAARIIARVDPVVPLVIQPAAGACAPATEVLLQMQEAALDAVPDVRIIPQVHRWLGVP